MSRSDGSFEWIQVAWHVLGAWVVLTVPPLVRFGVPVWSPELPFQPLMLALGATYALGAALLVVIGHAARSRPAVVVSLISTLLLVLVVGVMSLSPYGRYSRSLLLIGMALIAALLGLGSRLTIRWASFVWVPFLVGLGATGAGLLVEGSEGPRTETTYLQTNRLTLRMESYWNYFPADTVRGGAMAPVGDAFLVARGRGQLYRLAWDDGDSLHVNRLDLRVPINREAFEADTAKGVESAFFRVADLMVLVAGDSVELYASHHYWFDDRRCFVLRLSAVTLPSSDLPTVSDEAGLDWRTVYDTRPCLPIKSSGNWRFAGQQSGGRLASLDRHAILMTVGDHDFDGLNAPAALAQDASADYGKTLMVHPRSGTAEIFTTGHRNPQGLTVTAGGTVWSTEHGPKGGDELNLLRAGNNYGWPYATYGTAYGSMTWPLEDSAGTYTPPRFAWVPSIGVSAVMPLEGTTFREWRGDLLVGSLVTRDLWRVKLRGESVAYAERMRIGRRVRDIVQGPDGRIILWTDEGTIVRLSPARAATEGAVVFQRCQGCHTLGEGDRLGPDLAGIQGRAVASVDGYPYSAALERLGGRWTAERLDAFLADPDSFVPGTTMGFQGVTDPAERRALIRYLRRSR